MSADPKNIIAIHCKGGKGDAKDCDLCHCYFVIILLELNKGISSVQQFTNS